MVKRLLAIMYIMNLMQSKILKLIRIISTSLAMFMIILALYGFQNILIGYASSEENEPAPEYHIKAGYLYKFLFFVQWPEKAFQESDSTFEIGILGENHFGDIFRDVEGESINGRKLTVRKLGDDVRPEILRECQILFISRSLDEQVGSILSSLKDYPVLTVSETETFVKSGGMINFVAKEERIRFEINRLAAERVGIKIRAKLLRVAERVVEE